MKKVIATAILMSLVTITASPVIAIEEVSKSTATPKQFKSMATKNKRAITENTKYEYVNMIWWEKFGDEKLNGYIAKAIQNNYDLKMASLAVEEYYQQTRVQFANELPTGMTAFAPNLVKMMGKTKTEGAFALPILVQYEFDIFLKNRDKTKAVKKLWESSQLDERSAYITIASAVGTTYINLIKLDKIIDLQEEIVNDRKIIYDLMLLRHKEGITSTADTVRANKSYIAGKTELIELQKQREKLLHQMCVLIGESPENSKEISRSSLDEFEYNGIIPDEISSEVIVQRPDYMKAEKMVEKAGIDVRVAKKEFLPSLNLSGIALFNSSQLGSLFTTKNMLAGIGGAIFPPIITGGAKLANLRIKKAEYERILQNYYKTNLTAIQEVNDALVSIKADKEKFDETLTQSKLEKADYNYNEQKYNQGTISKLDLIQIKENSLVMDKMLASQKVECLVDYIGLYKAVGSKL